jgi:hypothetical protein
MVLRDGIEPPFPGYRPGSCLLNDLELVDRAVGVEPTYPGWKPGT